MNIFRIYLALSLYFPNNQMFIICKSREKCLWLDSVSKEFLTFFFRITQLNLKNFCKKILQHNLQHMKVLWMFNNWVLLCRRNFKVNCKRKEFLNCILLNFHVTPQWIMKDQKLHILHIWQSSCVFFPWAFFSVHYLRILS